MPWRPTNWWRGYQNLTRRDPTALCFAFAVYALLYGVALVLPGDSFEISPVYGLARELGLPETFVGVGMLLDAFLLFVCLGWSCTPTFRSIVSIVTGASWFFWGAILLAGGARAHYFSPGGAWSLLCSLIVMQATAGWVYPGVRPVLEPEDPETWN